jgi:hypothetical protein
MSHRERQKLIDSVYRNAVAAEDDARRDEEELASTCENSSASTLGCADRSNDLTRAFVRLSNLPTYPLDHLSRYEATLWRQACQILFTLRCLNRRKPWVRLR